MKGSTMQDVNKLKKPSRHELIRKSYCYLSLNDIDFIIKNDLGHDEITK